MVRLDRSRCDTAVLLLLVATNFVTGTDREQGLLLPESLEDYAPKSSSVRSIVGVGVGTGVGVGVGAGLESSSHKCRVPP